MRTLTSRPRQHGSLQTALFAFAVAVGISGQGRVFAETDRTYLTTIAECLANVRDQTNTNRQSPAVNLTATVTLVDGERGLLFLQDGSAAMAVQTAFDCPALMPEQRVKVEGSAIAPYVRAFPAYPDQPSESGFLDACETLPGRGTYYLTRIRGYLHPPTSGQYTFWVSADDAAEVYLSRDASREKMQKIAENKPGSATGQREWDRYASQRSKTVTLKAGETYYLEALHVQSYGRDGFAVAWEGPGIKRSVIEGHYLTPYIESSAGLKPPPNNSPPTHGLLQESWTNFFVREFDSLRLHNPHETIVRIDSLKLTVTGEGEPPMPQQIDEDTNIESVPNLNWVQLEGEVDFATANDGQLQFELKRDDSVLGVHVLNWKRQPSERLVHSRVRVRGVLEHAYGPRGDISDNVLWVADDGQVHLLDEQENQDELVSQVSICDIEPSDPEMRWGRQVTVRGRVIQQGTNGLVVLRGGDNYTAFCSQDGTNWMALGKPVELGMSNSVLAGLAVVSRLDTARSSASFSSLKGFGTNWLGAEIGDPALTGHFELRNGTLTVTGNGRKIGDRGDQLYYLYQSATDELELRAQLTDFVYSNALSQTGLMIRESLDARSPIATVLFAPASGPVFQYRRNLGDVITGFEARREYDRFRWLKLVRQKSVIEIQGKPGPGIGTNQVVNVTGMITWRDRTPILKEAFFESAQSAIRAPQPAANELSQPISSFVFRVLHPPEPYLLGRMSSPLLQGVVTFCGEFLGRRVMFVQSGEEGAIQVGWSDSSARPKFEVGQRVEMIGLAPVRRFPVILQPSDMKLVGWGTLPKPEQFSSSLIKEKTAQARWVEATGVVRSEDTNGVLNLMTKDGPLAVWVGASGKEATSRYVDAALRVRGVLSLHSSHIAYLLVPSSRFVEELERAPADPFAIPSFSISDLAALEAKPGRLRRMKLAGVVTCCLPQGIYVQDKTGGAFVPTGEVTTVHPGDRVEAVGFPDNTSISLILTEATIRKTGDGVLPDPLRVSSTEDLRGKKIASTLVSLDGTLLEQRETHQGQLLTLQMGTKVFEAALPMNTNGLVPQIELGSRVSVCGVLQIDPDASRFEEPGSETIRSAVPFVVWLRAPTDLAVLESPPWWTLKRAAWAGSLFACGLFGTLIWVRILRRRVAQRTHELQATMKKLEKETRASAVLAERDRLAGEIHDSLEQGLTAIMLQLDAADRQADQSPQAGKFVRMARNMAEFSRTEVQHAVWDMQSPLLANADLGTALKHVAGLTSSGLPEVKVEIIGPPRQLPSSCEHHLLRIAQEAITNAVKHAQARSINVTVDYSRPNFKLIVVDDGAGFVPESVKPGMQAGHFGLHGLRVRAQKIGAQLDIASETGKGTSITVKLSLNGERSATNSDQQEPI